MGGGFSSHAFLTIWWWSVAVGFSQGVWNADVVWWAVGSTDGLLDEVCTLGWWWRVVWSEEGSWMVAWNMNVVWRAVGSTDGSLVVVCLICGWWRAIGSGDGLMMVCWKLWGMSMVVCYVDVGRFSMAVWNADVVWWRARSTNGSLEVVYTFGGWWQAIGSEDSAMIVQW